MAKPWVYIASPYTKGDPAINVRCQMKMFDRLLSDGFVVPFAPLMSHFQHLSFPRPYEDWIQYDLELLKRFDAVLRIDATELVGGQIYLQSTSSGADGEVGRATELGKPVFYRVDDLYAWARNLRNWKRPGTAGGES